MPHLIYTNSDQNNYTNINFLYLLGFQPSLGYMLIEKNRIIVFMDSRYIGNISKINLENIKSKTGVTEIIFEEIKPKEFFKTLEKFLKKSTKITIDKSSSIEFYTKLKKNFKNVKAGKNIFEEKRIIKQSDEIENIKKAIKIIDSVFESILAIEKSGEIIGKTEKEIRNFIISEITKNGGEKESFSSIVAFGKNSSIPHHITGDDIIGNGPLLIDIGAKYNHYCSDFTRTIWVGEKDESFKEFKKIYEVVLGAYKKALKNIKVGSTGKEIDEIARNHIKENGYGEYFTHSLGHGVGLEIHESPYLNKKSKDILKENMFFTNEPGIYLPNKFGVRLENILHLEKDGVKVYSEIDLEINK